MFQCYCCRHRLLRSSFSNNQLKKKGNRRRCKKCISGVVVVPAPIRQQSNQNTSRKSARNLKLLNGIKTELNEAEYIIFKNALKKNLSLKHSNDAKLFKQQVIKPFYELFNGVDRDQYFDKLARYIPRQFANCYSNTIQNNINYNILFEDVKKILNNQCDYGTFKNAMTSMQSCRNKTEFKNKVIDPLWLLFKHRPLIFDKLGKYIPSSFAEYYLPEIRSKQKEQALNNEVHALMERVKQSMDEKEHEIFKQILNNIKMVANEIGFKQNVMKPLLSTFPPYHECRHILTSSLKFQQFYIPAQFRDIYRIQLQQNEKNVHNLVVNRICNGFNDKYGIFAALGFIDVCEYLDIRFTDNYDWDKETLEDYCIFEDDEKGNEHLKDRGGLQLDSLSDEELIDFVHTAMRDKSYDLEIFDNQSRKLKYNPLPPKLLNKRRFIRFVTTYNKCLPQCFLNLIYEYLTGYLFDIGIPIPTRFCDDVGVGDERVIDCYHYQINSEKLNELRGIKLLSMNNSYEIRWTKCRNMFAVGKVNMFEFVVSDHRICIGCIKESDFDCVYGKECKYYAILLKRILDHYGCHCKNLKRIDLAWIDYYDLSQKTVFFDNEESYLELKYNILKHCRDIIHSKIQQIDSWPPDYSLYNIQQNYYDSFNISPFSFFD